jgi:hypothetical protein
MRKPPEKKFIVKAPIIGPVAHYWSALGRGNTANIEEARRYGEKQARELKEKEPLLELIPV